MILSFTAIDASAQLRNFFYQQEELENALDILSAIASQGDTLLNACIIDEKSRLELPVEAFDGQQFSDSIKQLEKQWQTVLSESTRTTEENDTWYVELTRQRVKLYEDRLDQLTKTINQLEVLYQHTEDYMFNERLRTNLINRYSSLLAQYGHYRTLAQAGQKQALERLSLLECC
ncbi:hypothetical protein [Spirosoma sp.]|uniref:hypothetical protein n=1 Tax=Spirosoma sp. TaxID=1899569 RepID=UPI003B3B3938